MAINIITELIRHELAKHGIIPTSSATTLIIANNYSNTTNSKRTLVWYSKQNHNIYIRHNIIPPPPQAFNQSNQDNEEIISTDKETNNINEETRAFIRQACNSHNPQDPNFSIETLVQEIITWLSTPLLTSSTANSKNTKSQ